MHYMGINDIEDVLGQILYQFHKKNGPRKILKVIMPPELYTKLRKASYSYLNRQYLTKEEWEKLDNNPLYWDKILIEEDSKVKRIVVVPEGSLAECIYV